MLAIRRRFELPLANGVALRRFDGLTTLGFRIYVVETRGVVFDTDVQRLLLGAQPSRAGQLAIVLDGEYVFRKFALQTLRVGDVVVAPLDGWDERWDGGDFRLLVIDWEATHGAQVATASTARLDREKLAALTAFADAMQTPGSEGACELALADVVDTARALGAPLCERAAWPVVETPQAVARVHAALSKVLTRSGSTPRWVDIETEIGVTERTLRRWVDAHPQWFGWYPSFRQTTLYWRLSSAAMFVTADRSRLEDIARLTGYGSSRALIHALETHGLGAPSELRRALGLRPRG